MKFFSIKILFGLLIFSGCENVDVVETKLAFKEKIVVRAELIPDSVFAGVSFTRTLPIDEQYDISKAEIKDAVSFMKINYTQVIPLHYSGEGMYKPLYDYEFESGNVVELFGDVNGKSVYSKTIIPGRPSISSTFRESKFLSASVIPQLEEVYGARWIIYSSQNNSLIDAAEEFHNIAAQVNNSSFEIINVRTSDIPEEYLSGQYINQTYIQVYSFDKAYLEYFKSRSNNQLINNTFTQGGGSVAWNVYGNDVIGLFIGIAKGNRIKVN